MYQLPHSLPCITLGGPWVNSVWDLEGGHEPAARCTCGRLVWDHSHHHDYGLILLVGGKAVPPAPAESLWGSSLVHSFFGFSEPLARVMPPSVASAPALLRGASILEVRASEAMARWCESQWRTGPPRPHGFQLIFVLPHCTSIFPSPLLALLTSRPAARLSQVPSSRRDQSL